MTDYQTLSLAAEEFKSGIVPFENLTQPSASGLEGVLYDRGFSCQLNVSSLTSNTIVQAPKLIAGQNKIALVKKGGGCNFYQKVYYSELDGAAGVIIYDDIPFREDENSGSMKIAKGNLTITMYYVDLNIGLALYNMSKLAASEHLDTTTSGSQPAILLTMHPAVGGFPSAWEFTLIIIVALLAISFLASVGMHWHLWRIRRRQRAFLFENGVLNLDPGQLDQALSQQQQQVEKTIIDPSQLYKFPIRIIQYTPTTSSSNDTEPNSEHLHSPTAATDEEGNTSDKEPKLSIAHNPYDAVTTASCVICLDEFSEGDTVRQLPCHHEYHCECIDPWLTIKSACCPLCKYDCTLSISTSTSKNDLTTTTTTNAATAASTTVTDPVPSMVPSPFSSLSFPFRRSPSPRPPSTVGTSTPSPPPPTYFGPTIRADNAETFSRSWMARSLPRSMRRQIQEAIIIQQQQDHEDDSVVIELPTRMTTPPSQQQRQHSSIRAENHLTEHYIANSSTTNSESLTIALTAAPTLANNSDRVNNQILGTDTILRHHHSITDHTNGDGSNTINNFVVRPSANTSARHEERGRMKKWKRIKLPFFSRE